METPFPIALSDGTDPTPLTIDDVITRASPLRPHEVWVLTNETPHNTDETWSCLAIGSSIPAIVTYMHEWFGTEEPLEEDEDEDAPPFFEGVVWFVSKSNASFFEGYRFCSCGHGDLSGSYLLTTQWMVTPELLQEWLQQQE